MNCLKTKINKIILKSKSVILKLNNGSLISIFMETYIDLNLKENDYIDLNYLKERDDYYACLSLAKRLLVHRDYSIKKLREKLNVKFKKSTINSVLFRLNELSILNEKTSILNKINILIMKGYGERKIRHILLNKGFNLDDVDFSKFSYNIDILITKYKKTHKEEDKQKFNQNLIRYLYNNGYEFDDIYVYLLEGENKND